MKIGNRIKNLRTSQRITLSDLAKKTGLTTSFLSQLERDLVSPSVSSLEKISSALNTEVAYFFEEAKHKGLVFIKKGAGGKTVDKERNVVSERLASGLLNIKMEPFIFTLRSGAELTKELIYPEGERFGMVLKGRIEISCNGEKTIFEEGDSIYCVYPAVPQKVINIDQTEAKLLWIMFTKVL